MKQLEILEAMKNRHAVKAHTGEKVEAEKVRTILEAARLSPTASGLQPVKIVVVTNKALKKELRKVGDNQRQIEECSHLLVFAAWDKYTDERIAEIIDYTEAQRKLPEDKMEKMKQGLIKKLTNLSDVRGYAHSSNQAAITFGVAVATAALLQVDASPMEGFDPPAFDKLLGLDKEGFKSLYLLALGHKDVENDWMDKLKKVRRPMKEFVRWMR